MNSNCPLCLCNNYEIANGYSPKDVKAEFTVCRCLNCGHLYSLIDPGIDIRSLYDSGDYEVVDMRGSIFDKLLQFEYSKVLNVINKFLPKKGSLLDFGCGKGHFLGLAKKDGWKTLGVETSAPRASYAKQIYRLDVVDSEYHNRVLGEGGFNVITLFHVVEHLADPKRLLIALVENNIKKSGMVLIEVPNFGSLQSVIAGSSWLHLDFPRHISHFTERKLVDLLSYLGLSPVRYEYFSFHLGVLGMVQCLAGLLGYKKKILFELKYKRTVPLIIIVILLLPAAFMLELIASFFKKGGIIRIYSIKGILRKSIC